MERKLAAITTKRPEYQEHIDKAIESRKRPIRLPRTMGEIQMSLGEAPYVESPGELQALIDDNCHVGQRKLALALIEFMNLAVNKVKRDVFVVYPGASLMACLGASDLFPTARFLCFDPAFDSTVTNVRRELGKDADKMLRNVHIIDSKKADADAAVKAFRAGSTVALFTREAGMYGDLSHTLALEVQDGLFKYDGRERETLFCSDVRMSGEDKDPSETQIATEMVAQARWVKNINVKCFVLKMRLPFPNASGKIAKELLDVYKTLFDNEGGDVGDGSTVPYLAGDRYIQLYGRPTTTEMRLIGLDGVDVKQYTVSDVERVMAAFNVVHRAHTCFKPSRPISGASERGDGFVGVVKELLTPESMGDCCSYDGLSEACIVHDSLIVSGGAYDMTTLKGAIERFNLLFATGRHPKTCIDGGGLERAIDPLGDIASTGGRGEVSTCCLAIIAGAVVIMASLA